METLDRITLFMAAIIFAVDPIPQIIKTEMSKGELRT